MRTTINFRKPFHLFYKPVFEKYIEEIILGRNRQDWYRIDA